jgi:CheY-like chemotaxis protein
MPVMPNKALRIMIADSEHFHRMRLERLFNQLGYFRIAPVNDMEELLLLVEYGSEPFDVIVANARLANGGVELADFLVDNPQVLHGLIYNMPQAGVSPQVGGRRSHVQLSQAALPDPVALACLMARAEGARISERARS